MPVIADIKEELNDLTTFKYISGAFTEASAVKLRNIRSSFEKNSRFYEEVTHLYHLVELSAKKAQLNRPKTTAAAAVKTLSIAITSNLRFFGNLNLEIIKTYIDNISKINTDLIVIGSTGHEYLDSINFNKSYEKIVFPKDLPTNEETRFFLYKTIPYDKVMIYYPKFISFLTQSAGVTDITQKTDSGEDIKDEETSIIFEPELSKMLDFFETQVRIILFRRVLLETDLARTAARLLTMSQAEERSDREIMETKIRLRKIIRSYVNTRLLETFSGIREWRH